MRTTLLERMEGDLPLPYDNPHGVEFSGDFDSFISVGCDWPGFKQGEDIAIGFMYENNMKNFVKDFNVRRFRRIDQIRPRDLVKMYHDGRASVMCFRLDIDYFVTLNFIKKGKRMFATNYDDEEHEVFETLQSPEAFLEYFRIYFLTH